MIRLVSLNVERSKHLDLVLPFLRSQNADIVCLQEIMERDIPAFTEALRSVEHVFAPTSYHRAEVEFALEGVALFSRFPFISSNTRYYKGSLETVHAMRVAENGNPIDPAADMTCPLITALVENAGESFTLATTHFTWSRRGEATDMQRQNMRDLLALLSQEKEFVLGGDLNAPRGGEIFAMLAEKYKDNIPPQYTTSIDKDLHRAGDLQLMVDGLFSTPRYTVANVELHSGVSDHMAITATIEKGESA